ncbi:MAG: twin-arginine translocase subunit TatC [Marinilabiliaceae bacterium]|nr:twin-arginine translocase subunit TatC [Marinilabiliaceae bacterium]
MTFWDHIEELRWTILHIFLVLCSLAIILFCFKEPLFNIALAPAQPDFILYRWLDSLASLSGIESMHPTPWQMSIINTRLTGQLMTHIELSLYGAVILGMPAVLWLLFRYLTPALYKNEIHTLRWLMVAGEALFLIGVFLCYILIFPLALRFLATYNVSDSIRNMIDLASYFDLLLILSVMMGLVFELPLICILLSKMGFINATLMAKYRRHAIVGIVTLSAILTPTTDIMTLFLVSIPIYLLYEMSRLIIR